MSKGGYIFVDRGGFRGVLSLWLTSLPLILAARAGRPTAVVATSIGPFEQRLSRVTSSWILKRVGLVLARDPRSYEEALNLGLRPERVMEVPDVVFGMRGPTPDEVAAMTARYGLSTGRYGTTTVQRGPAAGPVDRRHLHELAVAMMRLLETGYIDRLAIVVQVDGDTSDLAQSRTLAEEIHDERVVLISDDLGPEELIALYGGAAFAVCGRLHSAIFSLMHMGKWSRNCFSPFSIGRTSGRNAWPQKSTVFQLMRNTIGRQWRQAPSCNEGTKRRQTEE